MQVEEMLRKFGGIGENDVKKYAAKLLEARMSLLYLSPDFAVCCRKAAPPVRHCKMSRRKS